MWVLGHKNKKNHQPAAFSYPLTEDILDNNTELLKNFFASISESNAHMLQQIVNMKNHDSA